MGIYQILMALILISLSPNIFGDDTNSRMMADESLNDGQNSDVDLENKKVAENHVTMQIFQLIEHYKKEDPIGLPVVPIPDPLKVPDLQKSVSLTKLSLMNSSVYGISQFRIKHFKTNLKEMKVDCGIQIDVLYMIGNYTLSAFFSKSNGPYSITLKGVYVNGNATVGVEKDGKLKSQDIKIDVTFSDMQMSFQNLGMMGSIFQSIANSASNQIFDTVKPFILTEAYTKIKEEIDSNLKQYTGEYTLPNSISPVDAAIAELRKNVRNMGFDPFKVKDYNNSVGIFGVKVTHTWIRGISSFYRVGQISLNILNNTAFIGIEVGTQLIEGSTQWELAIAKGMITRSGHVQFTVQHIKVAIEISQTLDLRNHPQIVDLQIELGNIQIRSDGVGTADYLIEFFVNVLPNLLRYQIMDALEKPIKLKIQEAMDKIDVERFVKEKVPEFQKQGMDMNMDFSKNLESLGF